MIRTLSIAAIVLSGLCFSTQAAAQQGRGGQARERGDAAQADLSRSVRSVERSTGARVISAERVSYGSDELHRIKTVDDDGRVRTFIQHPERRDDARKEGQDADGDPTRGHDS